MLAFDAHGNLVIAGSGDIRALAASTGTFYGQDMTQGVAYTVAGGNTGARGDGGSALCASIQRPDGVAVDSPGCYRCIEHRR